MRFDKIVCELIHKNLIARVDRAARDHFAPAIGPSGVNIKITSQRVRRGVNEKILLMTHQSGKSEKEEKLLLLYLQDLVIHLRDHLDIISAAHNKLGNALQKVRYR